MNRRIGIVLVLATIVGAFFLGRATRDVPSVWGAGVPVSGEGPQSREGRARLSDIARAYPDAGPTGRSTPRPDTAQAAAPHLTPIVPESGSGPRPLSAESEQRLRNMAERMVRLDERAGELYELAENEPAGPDSAYLEDLIATAIRRHGGGFTGLEVSRPRCTQSVCMMMATGASNSQDPRSDWQRLSLIVMNQPWFRQYFDDMTGTVTGDAKGALYLTYYIRCARGTCLYGDK